NEDGRNARRAPRSNRRENRRYAERHRGAGSVHDTAEGTLRRGLAQKNQRQACSPARARASGSPPFGKRRKAGPASLPPVLIAFPGRSFGPTPVGSKGTNGESGRLPLLDDVRVLDRPIARNGEKREHAADHPLEWNPTEISDQATQQQAEGRTGRPKRAAKGQHRRAFVRSELLVEPTQRERSLPAQADVHPEQNHKAV